MGEGIPEKVHGDSLKGKTAIITGGGRGIGRAIAISFARLGANVVLAARTEAEIDSAAQNIKEIGGKAIAVKADITKINDVKRLLDTALNEFEKVDILVNNAGYLPSVEKRDLNKTTEQDYDATLAVNLKGVFLCSKAVLEHMIQRNSGCIVNIASMAAKRAHEGSVPIYSASKFGVMGFSQALAKQVVNHGINVCVICPGGVDTKLLAEYAGEAKDSESMLQPEDVAEVVTFVVTRPKKIVIPEIVVIHRNEITRYL